MAKLEHFLAEQMKTLVPNYDTVELKATVSSSSFSVEFFVTVDGKRKQCFQMIDDGQFTEKNFNIFLKPLQIMSGDCRILIKRTSINTVWCLNRGSEYKRRIGIFGKEIPWQL